MNPTICNVRDIDSRDRQALEHVLGQPLEEDQRVIIHVENAAPKRTDKQDSGDTAPLNIPSWCNVYEGLTDEEIDQVEKIALSRADMTRAAGDQ